VLSYEPIELGTQQTRIPVLMSASPLPKAIGGAVFLMRDLSMIKRLRELESMGQVYRELAIQTKTPLSLASTWLKQSPLETETVKRVVRELSKVQLTYPRLALYGGSGQAFPFQKVLLSPRELIKHALYNFPEYEHRKISYPDSSGLPDVYIEGDLFQLSFCLRTVISYLLRFVPQAGKVTLEVAYADGCLTFQVAGLLPPERIEADDSDPGNDIGQALADIALGKEVLQAMAARHGGRFDGPGQQKGRGSFELVVPAFQEPTP
jgi:hypothetical protein